MLEAVTTGVLTGLALIVAIGAQNAYVLRQGITRSQVGPVVAVCAISDVVLIAAGVAGVGVLIERAEWLVETTRWLGVAFLIGYGLFSLRRAYRADSLHAEPGGATVVRWQAVVTALALTWLNPHVYLDTVVLLGSIASTHGDDRWWFALGAAAGSIAWFSLLGYGARFLAPVLARPRAWQILDVAIGVTMLVLAFSIARG
ncbi:LysE/ArgO family amino acid transporter [Nocardioides sp. Bht2]|uniref:LysE/ArgO family amino acid transporter n=1 Tax=Nocardioides sp. Bht2 TaxID=3392297 RepID=UPI0039B62DB4